jgi:hypothetical protein
MVIQALTAEDAEDAEEKQEEFGKRSGRGGVKICGVGKLPRAQPKPHPISFVLPPLFLCVLRVLCG